MSGCLFCDVVPGVHSSLTSILLRKREMVVLRCVVCLCSVSLPHGAIRWSAIYDFGMVRSYSLVFWPPHVL